MMVEPGFGMDGGFTFIFIIAFAIILISVISGIIQWGKNNQSPRLTVQTIVVTKRTEVSGGLRSDDDFHSTPSSTYYVTFEVESGDRMELIVSGGEYGKIVEGDVGSLTFQGTRFIQFERNI